MDGLQAPLWIGPERKRVERLPAAFAESDPHLVVRDVNDFFRRLTSESGDLSSGAYLVVVPPRTMSDVSIPDELREQRTGKAPTPPGIWARAPDGSVLFSVKS